MRKWCVCGLAPLFLLLTTHFARAYERDVHYDLTKYLARWAAFSESEAEQIAVADQELDAKLEFNPLPNIPQFCPQLSQLAVAAPTPAIIQAACKDDPEFQRMLTAQRAFHFVDGTRLQALRGSAVQSKNLKTLGHYLHALQDTFAHSLMDYRELPTWDKLVANLGFLPDEKIIGHLMYGQTVDKTYERPDLAELMARYVYSELTHLKGSANRWTEVEASIARFARERDAQKKLAYLSASPASQAAQMPLQPKSPARPSQEAMAIKHIYAQPVNDQFMTDTTIDNETGVRFSRVFYGTPDISVLKGWQCGWSIEVIGELPRSRDPLTDEMVKTILGKGKNFALPFACPATEHIRVFLLDLTFTTILGYKPQAKVEGDFSSRDNFETVADFRTQTPAPLQAASQHEQESKSSVQAQQKQGAPQEPLYQEARKKPELAKQSTKIERSILGISLGQPEATARASLARIDRYEQFAQGVRLCVSPTGKVKHQTLKACFYDGQVESITQRGLSLNLGTGSTIEALSNLMPLGLRHAGFLEALAEKYGPATRIGPYYYWDDGVTTLAYYPEDFGTLERWDNRLRARSKSEQERQEKERAKKALGDY